MADALPFFAAETGTYSTTGLSVTLSGTAANLGVYPSRTFAAADADTTTTFASGNTCTVVIVKDASNYKRYSGATWTDASPDTISLASATLEGSAGTISNSDSVTVYASLPSAPLAHDHSSNKLAQANTHESADTDTATSSLHHTIGTGATNAAAGNHTHSGVYEPASNITTAARTVLDDTTTAEMLTTLGAQAKLLSYRKSGVYHTGTINNTGALGTTSAQSPGLIRAYPLIVQNNWTITGLRGEVTTSGGTGKLYRVALYSDDGSYYPGGIVAGTDVGEASADTIAGYDFTFSQAITLTPGVYWSAFLTDGTPVMRSMSTSSIINILGYTTSGGLYVGYSKSQTYGAMPETFPSSSNLSTASQVAVLLKTQ